MEFILENLKKWPSSVPAYNVFPSGDHARACIGELPEKLFGVERGPPKGIQTTMLVLAACPVIHRPPAEPVKPTTSFDTTLSGTLIVSCIFTARVSLYG